MGIENMKTVDKNADITAAGETKNKGKEMSEKNPNSL
jgi:hypothetical protein